MPISVLGITELSADDGTAVHVGGLRRRAALAVLALEINRTVPTPRLLDAVWDDRPPPQARAAIQGHVAVLRRLLPPSLQIETREIGYRLSGESGSVDALRFSALADLAAGTADDAEAARLLDTALGLWRGEPLADLTSSSYFRGASGDLARARERALEAWAWRRLRLGQGADAVPALQAAVRGDAVCEPLIGMLMLCLYQSGRQAEAVEVFHGTRRRLEAEFGTRPGAQLQEALARVLRGPDTLAPRADSGVRPARHAEGRSVPRQLPRPQFGFAGRGAQLGLLAPLAEDPGTGARARSRLAIVSGAAGAGKTALILHWAHRAAERFPDGQLYADLRGVAPDGPADPSAVLTGFLRALGVDGGRIPADRDRAAALFRELTRDRRLLVVLDDAAGAEQVRPLLPDGPACATVVASRCVLADLAVDRTAALHLLPPLTLPDAWAVLELSVDPGRLRADPASTEQLIQLCDRLPLALRLAASGLAVRPSWSVADLVESADVEQGFLEVLDRGRGVGVSAALDLTRRRLTPDAMRLLPLLGLYPGTVIDPYAAGALLRTGIEPASSALMNLAAWNLVRDDRPGMYSWPSLVGGYARRLLAEELGNEQAREPCARLARYFASAARSAHAATSHHGLHVGGLHFTGLALRNGGSRNGQLPYDGPLLRWKSSSQASSWLDENLGALRRLADDADRFGLASERRELEAVTAVVTSA